MENRIHITIQNIKLLAQQNPMFRQEMQKIFGAPIDIPLPQVVSSIENNISAIRQALEIKAQNSISYDFVKEQRLRDQLYIDNLRMENAALNLKEKEIDRFYIFCVNAFYQIENIVNYYFYVNFPDIEELLKTLERYTAQEKEKYRYKRPNPIGDITVADIPIFYKLNAICNILFFFDSSVKINLSNLRQIRNLGEHRCHILIEENDKRNRLHEFFQKKTFTDVRNLLRRFVNVVKNSVKQQKITGTDFNVPTNQQITIEGTIQTLLPGCCFVSYNNNTKLLPLNLFEKVKEHKAGDPIIIHLLSEEITDITFPE